MKINGVYGSVHLEKLKQLVEQQGVDPSVAETAKPPKRAARR